MSFCKFSTEYNASKNISLDVVFVRDYMPFAPDGCTKVYLHGLMKCVNDDGANTIDGFAEDLKMPVEDIKSSFLFWQEQGLVNVLNLDPIEVRYLPVRPKDFSAKMFSTEKYSSFNASLQEIVDGRMITPHEYKEFYLTMQSLHIEEDAMLMIAKYCTNLKGNTVGYSYILTVAKNWAYDNVRTVKDVENKLMEMETLTSSVKDVLVALRSKKQPSFEDKEMFVTWTKVYGFDENTILHIAKKIKRGGITKLNELLECYSTNKLFSISEIDEYESSKDSLFALAKDVCNALGIYYENLNPVISTYILKWQQMGYSADVILLIAKTCFKKFIRTFEGMDEVVGKYYAKGLVSVDAINEYITSTLSVDKKIKEMLEKLGLSRQVTSYDRDFYHTWTYSWNFADDMIDYALSLATGKSQPMQYVNKILSNWKEQGIVNLEMAKNAKQPVAQPQAKKPEFITHSFSSEELNALFDNLDEVKLI
jgi:DnaD/phage-associated family protein